MVFQLLAGTHMIDVNLDLKSDRELYQTAQVRDETGDYKIALVTHATGDTSASFRRINRS